MDSMAEYLNSIFDDFTLQARVLPALIILLPYMVILGYSVEFKAATANTAFLLVSFVVLVAVVSKFVREAGCSYAKNNKDVELSKTLKLMSFDDTTIPCATKIRYYSKLNEYDKTLQLPMSLDEENSLRDAENRYRNAEKVLRIYSNTKRNIEIRPFQELKEYHFWRNLYGCKWYAVGLYLSTIYLIQTANNGYKPCDLVGSFNFDSFPTIILFIALLAWLFVVREDIVILRSEGYAKALLEVSESIKK